MQFPIICENLNCRAVTYINLPKLHPGSIHHSNRLACFKCGHFNLLPNMHAWAGGDGTTSVEVSGISRQQMNIFEMLVQRDIEILRSKEPTKFEIIQEVARRADAGEMTEKEAAAQIAEYLPSESAAAVKKLGSNNRLNAFIVAAGLLTAVAGSAKSVMDLFVPAPAQTVVAAPPAPPITIHNHNTVINQSAPEHTGSIARPPVIKREHARRIKQIEKQSKKRADSHREHQPKPQPYPKPEGNS